MEEDGNIGPNSVNDKINITKYHITSCLARELGDLEKFGIQDYRKPSSFYGCVYLKAVTYSNRLCEPSLRVWSGKALPIISLKVHDINMHEPRRNHASKNEP